MCSQENAPRSPSQSRRDRMACPVNMSSLRDSEPMWGDASLLHTGHPSGIQEEEHHFSDSL